MDASQRDQGSSVDDDEDYGRPDASGHDARAAASERANHAEAAHLGEEAFAAIFDAAPDALVVVDETGTIVLANAQVEALFGYRREEVVGHSVDMLVPERLRGGHARHRTGYTANPRVRPMGEKLELSGTRKDGSEFPLEISLSPVRGSRGLHVQAAVRDASERKRVAERLEQQNAELRLANAAKDAFLANMSHELRTPLNAIIGFTGTLLMGLAGPLEGEQRSQLDVVQRNARHLLSLINDLLDLSRIEAGTVSLAPVETSCSDVVEDVAASLRPLAEEKGIALRVELPDETIPVRADPRALRQVLLNLGSNGVKFTESGGSVDLVLEQSRSFGTVVTTFVVRDTGIGIDESDLEKVFGAFEQVDSSSTRPFEGTGLGLYISRRLADLLGAEIAVESTLGAGTTFTVTLREPA